MKILIAADSFKESMTSKDVASTITKAFTDASDTFECKAVSIGDGGEGTVSALVDGTDGKFIELEVKGPLGNNVKSFYGISGDGKTAFIEMAAASGLEMMSVESRNPLKTSTYGTGELILDAINQQVERIIIGLGGSATNDGGAGMARALGVRFLDGNGQELDGTGGSLGNIADIDLSGLNPRIHDVDFLVASDVNNPLIGSTGATKTFGRQKGADNAMMEVLEANMTKYARKIKEATKRDVVDIPGSGAAGGLGAGLLAFTNARFQSGIEIVLDIIEFDNRLEDVNLVITGEGKLDSQTIYGKAPIGVAKRAAKKNIPVIAFCGITGTGFETVYKHGIDAVYPILSKLVPLDKALEMGRDNLYQTAYSVAKTLLIKEKQ